MNGCADFDLLMMGFIDQELGAAERAACDAHLGDCPCCRAKLEATRITIEISRGLPSHRLPENLVCKLRLLIRDVEAAKQDPSAGE